jgi:hypothetical protein
MDIVVWLRSLGLGKYEAAFRADEIDETVLPVLTAEVASRRSGTAASCSMLLLLLLLLLLCAPIRTARRLRQALEEH